MKVRLPIAEENNLFGKVAFDPDSKILVGTLCALSPHDMSQSVEIKIAFE